MNLLNAIYKLQVHRISGDRYKLVRIFKTGNDSHLNELFSGDTDVSFKRLSPAGLVGDYVVYPLEFKNGNGKCRKIIFETCLALHPFGSVKIADSPTCMFFRELDSNIFEIYVSDNKISQNLRAQLFTMLLDGSLKSDIDRLLSAII